MQNSTPRFPPTVALGLAIFAASTSSLFVRFAQEEVASLTIAALRLTFASLFLAPFLLTRQRAELASYSRYMILLSLGSGALLAIHFATWISSLEFTSVASSVVLVQTSPLFVALMSALLLREKISRPVFIGLGLALLGSLVVGLSDTCANFDCSDILKGKALKGDLLALVGGISGAGYIVIGRSLRRQISLVSYIGVVYSTAAVVLLALMLMAGQSPFGLSPTAYVWIILLAIFPQLIAHSTYNWALRFVPATVVAVTLLGEPIAAAYMARVFLDEVPSVVWLLGGALTLSGIALVSIKRKQHPD
jgi:drug/metabolite transporter (DMT)-like permease